MYILSLGGDGMHIKKIWQSVWQKLRSAGQWIARAFKFRKGNFLDQIYRIAVIFIAIALVGTWVGGYYFFSQDVAVSQPAQLPDDFSKVVRKELQDILESDYYWVLEQPAEPVIHSLKQVDLPVDPLPDPQLPRPEVEPVEETLSVSFERILWPVKGNIATDYGWQRHPIYQDWRFNAGIEITTNPEEDVRSVLQGRVESILPTTDGFELVIEHGSGWQSLYRGIQTISVVTGEMVKQNQAIATASQKGEMFFALIYNEEPIDPLQYMSLY